MLAHPRSHSLYALACLGVWSTRWLDLLFAGTIAVFTFGWPLLVIIALLSSC